MLEIFDNICILLAKAEQKHNQFTKDTLAEEKIGVTPVQMMVLYTLYKGDGISISELGKKSYLDNSTLTGVIDRMETLGLVVRADVPGDRRAYNVVLTSKGRELQPGINRVTEKVKQAMFQGCLPQEVELFEKVLLRIFANL